MTVMVTGGGGFIGRRVAGLLVARGERVVRFDTVAAPPTEGAVDVRGDITQMTHLLEAIADHGVTRIVHLAALLPPVTEERPHTGLLVNIQGAANVFEAARWAKIERVVYASSIACYGDQSNFGDRAVTEDDPSLPFNVYGQTKAVNDFTAARYRERWGLDLRGIRICTVFGHGRATGLTGLIGGALISRPAVGLPADIPVDPAEASSMIYVDDAAEIFTRAVLSGDLRSPVYNTGGHLASVREIAGMVAEIVPGAKITFGEAKVPHVYLVDNSRMLRDIGYELAPLRQRILDHVNAARAEAALDPLAAPAGW